MLGHREKFAHWYKGETPAQYKTSYWPCYEPTVPGHGRLFHYHSLRTLMNPPTLTIANEIAEHLSGVRNDKNEEIQHYSFRENCSGGVYLRLICPGCEDDNL